MKIKIEFEVSEAAFRNNLESEVTNLIKDNIKKIAHFFERYPKIGKGVTNPVVNSHGVHIGTLTIEK